MLTHKGALPYQMIKLLVKNKRHIYGATEDLVNPSSLDLSLSPTAFRVDGTMLPRLGESVEDMLEELRASPHPLSAPLERGVTYLVKLNQRVALPDALYAYCNPKSSTGRADLHARVLVPGISQYDTIPAGMETDLWVVITPKSFPVIVGEGFRVSQARFFNDDTRFSEAEMQEAIDSRELLWNLNGRDAINYYDLSVKYGDGSVLMTLGLPSEGAPAGYRARVTNQVLDLRASNGAHNLEEFFEPVYVGKKGMLHLRAGDFYLLSTNEALRVPADLACEMAPMHERNGDFRVHYAGFIDPGFGVSDAGAPQGCTVTLEVRTFEDMKVRHGQPIGRVKFERLLKPADRIYGQTGGGHYQNQRGPTPAKWFKQQEAA